MIEYLLYIEPSQRASQTPIIDSITRKMCGAFRQSTQVPGGYGIHECFCGALSTSADYILPNQTRTNYLCIHYVAHHRNEVPSEQLREIENLTFGEADPDVNELQGPDRVAERIRAHIEMGLGADRLRELNAWGLNTADLVRGMQGGRMASSQTETDEHREAWALWFLLYSIQEDLNLVRASVEREGRDVTVWGRQALRTPGWKREAWVAPFAAILDRPENQRKAHQFVQSLDHAAAQITPTLIKLRERTTEAELHKSLDDGLEEIGRLGEVFVPAEVVPLLVKIVDGHSHSPRMRIHCARILGRTELGVPAAVWSLIGIILHDPEKTHRDLAEVVLFGLKKREPGIEGWHTTGMPLLLEALNDPDSAVCGRSIDLLSRSRCVDAIPALQELASVPSTSDDVRAALVRLRASNAAEQVVASQEWPHQWRAEFHCPFCQHSQGVTFVRGERHMMCPGCSTHFPIVLQD